MKRDEFAYLMNRVTVILNNNAKAGMPGYSNAKEFEKTVLAQLRVCCEGSSSTNPSFHDHAFPDVVVNSFGVEVKFTTKSTWQGTGNWKQHL